MSALIGITGRAGAGKSTVARRLVERWGFEELAFATPLKHGLVVMLRELGLTLHHVEDAALKEAPIPIADGTTTPRALLQTLGTDWGRKMVHERIWLEVMARRLERLHDANVVITDVRFANEAELLHQLGGIVWHIERGVAAIKTAHHASEAGIPSGYIDARIQNTTGTDALLTAVDALVAERL